MLLLTVSGLSNAGNNPHCELMITAWIYDQLKSRYLCWVTVLKDAWYYSNLITGGIAGFDNKTGDGLWTNTARKIVPRRTGEAQDSTVPRRMIFSSPYGPHNFDWWILSLRAPNGFIVRKQPINSHCGDSPVRPHTTPVQNVAIWGVSNLTCP